MGRNGQSKMGRAKKQVSADKGLNPAERLQAADFLSGTHARLGLWRMCKKKTCRRIRACSGDVDECGARCLPERWAWVHRVLKTIRDGRSRRAAVWAAGQDGRRKKIVDLGIGTPIEFFQNEDGTWTKYGARSELKFGTRFRRLTGCGSVWLDAAPRGEAKR
jgi:hypothetical protein